MTLPWSTQHLFSYTDMMITDASSILIDYLLIDKPIIISAVSSDYMNKIGFMSDDLFKCGYMVSSQKELMEKMLSELRGDFCVERRRDVLRKVCSYNDNKVLDRLVKFCNLE